MKQRGAQSGFTLVELVVSMAILSIILIAGAKILLLQGREIRAQAEEQDFQQLKTLVIANMRENTFGGAGAPDPARCEQALFGQPMVPSVPASADPSGVIYLSELFYAKERTAAGSPRKLIEVGRPFGQGIEICSLELRPSVEAFADPSGTGARRISRLVVVYALRSAGCTEAGAKRERSLGVLSLQMSGNGLIGCSFD